MKQSLLLIQLVASQSLTDLTDDLSECNLNRALGKKCPEDYIQNGHRFELIPATQRTNNLPGFAMDVTPWTTETQFWL